MTYHCDICGFVFSRIGEIQRCPSCEGYCIRPSTTEEAENLQQLVRDHVRNAKDE